MAGCRNLGGYLERAYVLVVYGGPVATLLLHFGPARRASQDRAQR
jgi:hypothetical protein